jgi:hypothetical protein
VLAPEHFLDFAGLDFLVQRFDRQVELGVDRLACLGPLHQYGEIVALLFERYDQFAILLEPAPALQNFLGFSLVFPEVGRGGARLETGQLLIGAGGLKDSSADPQRAC